MIGKFFIALGYFILFVLYLLIIGMWIAIPEELTLNLSTTIFTLVLTSILVIADRQRFAHYYQSGRFQKLATTLIASFLIFCILAMINFFAFKNPLVVDLTALKLNSLTDKTLSVLQPLDKQIRFKIFAAKKDHSAALALTELYRHANKNVEAVAYDVDIRPDLVRQYSIVKLPTIVVEYNGRREYISRTEELDFTNALIRLSRKQSPIIYFTVGHGEAALDDQGNGGLSEFSALMNNSSFELRPLELMRLERLPQDMSALAIVGPRSAFDQREISLIENYIASGGKVLMALDPQLASDPLLALRQLLERQSLSINNDFVIDSLNHVSGSDGTVPLVKELNREHLITKQISSYVFFPLVSSIQTLESFSGRAFVLAQSTPFPASWAEKNFEQLKSGKVTYDHSVDQKGPIALVTAFEVINEDKSLTRLVLLGNSTLIQNQYAKFVGNSQLLASALSWLTLDGQLDSFNLPFGENEPVFISGTQLGTIFYAVVIFVPLLLLAVALLAYRRNRAQ